MPVITYTDRRTLYEPEPSCEEDRLGMYVRWRVSGVLPMMIDGRRRLRATWDFEWNKKKAPSIQILIAGGLKSPAEQENYRYYWERINSVYETYLQTAAWFHHAVFLQRGMEDKWKGINDEFGELCDDAEKIHGCSVK